MSDIKEMTGPGNDNGLIRTIKKFGKPKPVKTIRKSGNKKSSNDNKLHIPSSENDNKITKPVSSNNDNKHLHVPKSSNDNSDPKDVIKHMKPFKPNTSLEKNKSSNDNNTHKLNSNDDKAGGGRPNKKTSVPSIDAKKPKMDTSKEGPWGSRNKEAKKTEVKHKESSPTPEHKPVERKSFSYYMQNGFHHLAQDIRDRAKTIKKEDIDMPDKKTIKENVDVFDLVNYALEQKPIEFGEVFDSLVTDMISAKVEEKKKAIASTMFTPQVEEEVEQVDELSVHTLAKYTGKAQTDAENRSANREANANYTRTHDEDKSDNRKSTLRMAKVDRKKQKNRENGIKLATHKIVKKDHKFAAAAIRNNLGIKD